MYPFGLVNASLGVHVPRLGTPGQEKETFAKEIEMTLARARSLPVKYSVVKMILVTSLEFT